MDFSDMSLEQIRAKQAEFLEALENEVRTQPSSSIDPVAIGQKVGIDSILVTEFIVYWVNMGRLDRAWLKVAETLREQQAYIPLKPPQGMVPDSKPKKTSQPGFSKEQRKVYADLWQDVLKIAEKRHTSLTSFEDRRKGAAFYNTESQIGYDGIEKVDKLAPYMDEEHYHLLRDYFTAYCNYYVSRRDVYLNMQCQDPNQLTEQDGLLYRRVFTSGFVEVEKLFREVLTSNMAIPNQGEKYDMDRKIKILFLASNPGDTNPLRLDKEMRAIDQAIRQAEFRDKFDIQQQWAVRVSELQGHLLRYKPDIVHFSGHGSTSSEIVLENESGSSQVVPSKALSKLFSVLKDNVRCVVLNACYSAPQAEAIAKSIDCVVGMSKAIGDESAIRFSAAFYQALGYGRNIKTAFELGCLQIDLENLGEEDTPKLLAIEIDPDSIVIVPSA